MIEQNPCLTSYDTSVTIVTDNLYLLASPRQGGTKISQGEEMLSGMIVMPWISIRAPHHVTLVSAAPNRRSGYAFLHNAVDDHSRLAYTEILTDEKKETPAGFWARANAYFESCGVVVKRVLTDNGSCYRSYERYNRTMLDEWAYAKPYASESERVAAFTDWLHHYNHHRGHTSLKGQPPASRVTNLSGQYT
ncbi:hypothetical protein QFZ30_002272 [Arthrobacter pascens]|nr:hypothetical protein [Arthrobacter pascens]